MSMFVGAVMPRQNTAFASEEVSVRIAAKDTRAALSNIMRRMGIPRKSAVHVLAWEALQHSPGKYRSKLVLTKAIGRTYRNPNARESGLLLHPALNRG
jgi:hypothetical protein